MTMPIVLIVSPPPPPPLVFVYPQGLVGPPGPPGPAGSLMYYTNPTPVLDPVGGIAAGSTFTDQSMVEMFDRLLYPAVRPPPLIYHLSAVSSWSMEHSFTYKPDVMLFDTNNGGIERIYATTNYPDPTHVALLFPTPFTGTVILR